MAASLGNAPRPSAEHRVTAAQTFGAHPPRAFGGMTLRRAVPQLLKGCGVDGAVVVTTPQEVALIDVRKEVNFCKKARPRADTCPRCGSPALPVLLPLTFLRPHLRRTCYQPWTRSLHKRRHCLECPRPIHM